VRIAVPRDRAGTFSPALVPKQATRSDGLNAVITSLYAKGMSVRDIARHVRQTAGVELSHDTVSRVTDAALEQMREWQHRPLEPFYPVIYVDALVAKVRDGSAVRNKAVNVAVGIDADGCKRVLGIWVAPGEGAKTWAQALAQLRNRGLEEVLFVCCDGQTRSCTSDSLNRNDTAVGHGVPRRGQRASSALRAGTRGGNA
jgi:putative transposase